MGKGSEFGKQVTFHCPSNTAHDAPQDVLGFINGEADKDGKFPIAVIMGSAIQHYSAAEGSEVGEFEFIS
jgi:hypothetical protein